MRLYVDIPSRTVVDSPSLARPTPSIALKRRDEFPLEIIFLSDGDPVDLAEGATGTVGLKANASYTGDYLASANSWTKTGTGTYLFAAVNLNTTEIDAAFTYNGEPASVPAMFEVLWIEGAARTSTNTLPVDLQNDVNRGDEGVPTNGTPSYPLPGAIELQSNKGQPSGYAGLDSNGHVPNAQLSDVIAASQLDPDPTFAADSDENVPSQKAVKTALAAAVPKLIPVADTGARLGLTSNQMHPGDLVKEVGAPGSLVLTFTDDAAGNSNGSVLSFDDPDGHWPSLYAVVDGNDQGQAWLPVAYASNASGSDIAAAYQNAIDQAVNNGSIDQLTVTQNGNVLTITGQIFGGWSVNVWNGIGTLNISIQSGTDIITGTNDVYEVVDPSLGGTEDAFKKIGLNLHSPGPIGDVSPGTAEFANPGYGGTALTVDGIVNILNSPADFSLISICASGYGATSYPTWALGMWGNGILSPRGSFGIFDATASQCRIQITTDGKVLIGSGSTGIKSILSAVKASFDCPSIAANGGVQTTTLTVTGATTTSSVIVTPSAALPNGLPAPYGIVLSANTVTLFFENPSTAALDPPSMSYRVTVLNF